MGEASYFIADIMRGRRHKVHIIEVEGKESIEEVVAKNFGDEAKVVSHRIPTQEEFILMRRSMIT